MTRGNIALLAVYVPLIVMAGWAAILYIRSVLWPAYRAHQLGVREHGIVIAMVASLGSDVVEQVYWSTARMVPGIWDLMSWATLPVFSMKVLATFGAMCAIAAWYQAVDHRPVLRQLLALAAGLYGGAFLTLLLMFGK